MTNVNALLNELSTSFSSAIAQTDTYVQIAIVIAVYSVATLLGIALKKQIPALHKIPSTDCHPVKHLAYRTGLVLSPLIGLFFIKVTYQTALMFEYDYVIIKFTLAVALLLFFYSLVNAFVVSQFPARLFKWIGLPILFLHVIGLLPELVVILEDISFQAGNVKISAYGVLRVLIFGAFLFWLGRVSNSFGKAVIKKQAALDVPTREVFTKLFEVALFCIVALLLLNVMGINLTTLAVFGGALGVGIGLGLQSIASNFISGIIILIDKSLTIGDYVELDSGQTGFVREFRMRYTVLETYDGKDVLVPNEMFISNLLINWSHKDPKQRYRVDFSVAYATDIRAMVEIVKEAVAKHPSVISGEDIPFEERPDCEIDSFGDSGVNMFVEFWMEGIDDGKNRVGGDLLLTIFETLKEHGIQIPFPQREVRILDPQEASATKR